MPLSHCLTASVCHCLTASVCHCLTASVWADVRPRSAVPVALCSGVLLPVPLLFLACIYCSWLAFTVPGLQVMLAALRTKFTSHAGPQRMLLSTAEAGEELEIVEASPNDHFWGAGYDGSGRNMLGHLLQVCPIVSMHGLDQEHATAGP